MMDKIKNYIEEGGKILTPSDQLLINTVRKSTGPCIELRECARNKCDRTMGKTAFLRATIEIGNICTNKCAYCGMSATNLNLHRYLIQEERILGILDDVVKLQIAQVHIVGGESCQYNAEMLARVVKYAVSNNLTVTLVLGERDRAFLTEMYQAGATRYILKFETSNLSAYRKAKGEKSLVDRVDHLFELRQIGFKIGTGNIYGLPYTDSNDIANDLALLKMINPDMASSSVFSPNKESMYHAFPPGSHEGAINFISLMRLLLKDNIYIPSSSALGYQGQIDALNSGANVISVNMTPQEYCEDFSIYRARDRIKRSYEDVINIIHQANMEVGKYV